jgi:hypothetical protein
MTILVMACGSAGGTDCDLDGIRDGPEIAAAPDADCNLNRILDSCEVAPGAPRFKRVPDTLLRINRSFGIADVSGDGIPDVVTDLSLRESTRLEEALLFMGRGDGSFQPPRKLDTGFYARSLVVGDMDRDADIDIVALNQAEEILLFANPGNGAYGRPRRTASGLAFSPDEILAGDIDADGDLDLIAADQRDVAFLANDGTGNFTHAGQAILPGFRDPELTDLDGDGHLDLVAASSASDGLHLLRNQGGGSFGEPTLLFLGSRQYFVAAGDTDNDDDIDLAATDSLGILSLLENRGNGEFDPPVRFPPETEASWLALSDMDLDGDLDLLSSSSGEGFQIFVNDGSGSFPEIRAIPATAGAILQFADFNLDGGDDLVIQDSNNGGIQFWIRERASLGFDCDRNGVPDSCQLSSGAGDSDSNGVLDSCESGLQMPGDCNQDGLVDISDSLCLIGVLFLGDPPLLPCGDGRVTHGGNIALLDWQSDGNVDISDAILGLQYLHLGGPPPPLVAGGECASMPGCLPGPSCE